jgi:hypothetical protein
MSSPRRGLPRLRRPTQRIRDVTNYLRKTNGSIDGGLFRVPLTEQGLRVAPSLFSHEENVTDEEFLSVFDGRDGWLRRDPECDTSFSFLAARENTARLGQPRERHRGPHQEPDAQSEGARRDAERSR